MGSTVIGHDTPQMRVWVNEVKALNDECRSKREELYNTIEELTTADLIGDVSDTYREVAIEKKPKFIELEDSTDSLTTAMDNKASEIDEDDNRLKNNIKNTNFFGN